VARQDDQYVPIRAVVAAFRWTGGNLPAAQTFVAKWIDDDRPADVTVQTIDTTIGLRQRYLDRTLHIRIRDAGVMIEVDEEEWLVVNGTDLPPGQRAVTVMDDAKFDATYRSVSKLGGAR
jgi:hypothetical protein